MAKKQSPKPQPVEEIRIGTLKAAIWRNTSETATWYNVTFQRLYRTEEGTWKSTTSFGPGDLLLLAKLSDAVHTRLLQIITESRQAAPPAAA
jgi:hypothetical protein